MLHHEFDKTPLHYAASNGATEVVRLIMNQGNIDINKADNNGKTALDYIAI